MTKFIIGFIVGIYLSVVIGGIFKPEYTQTEIYQMLINAETAYDRCERNLSKYEVKGTYTFTNTVPN